MPIAPLLAKALELLTGSQLVKVFRTAFDQNNAQLWLAAGAQFWRVAAFGAVKPLGVDLQRELAAFASCFIVVTKWTRTPRDVLMSHQVNSVQQQVQQVADRIDRLEGIQTELARITGEDTLMRSGASAQSCRAFALAQQLRGLFETLGYRFESHEVWDVELRIH
jgi:hypothetical protein